MRGQSSVIAMAAIIFVVIIFFGTLDYLQFLRYTIEDEYNYIQQLEMLKNKQLITFTEYVNSSNNDFTYLNITNLGDIATTIIGILVVYNDGSIHVLSENITILPQHYVIINTFIVYNPDYKFMVVTSLGNVFI